MTSRLTFTAGLTPQEIIKERSTEDLPLSLRGDDAMAVETVVDMGIDSHLEAFTASTFEWGLRRAGGFCVDVLNCHVVAEEVPLLLRRLWELYEEEGDEMFSSLRSGILEQLDIEEV